MEAGQLEQEVDAAFERFFGEMRGRDAVRTWIRALMVERADVHAVLDWYLVKGRRVVLSMQNRYYHPDRAGTPFDFPGVTLAVFAHGG